jgi:signal transduction histidine kinase
VHDNDVATNLYRIAQEAINNAIRHGGARALKLRLSADGQRGCLEVEDDGRGMPAPEAPSAGMGLRIMRYRADMCGGELHITARPGGGVLIRCTFRDHAPDSAGPAPAGPDGQVASGAAPGTAW